MPHNWGTCPVSTTRADTVQSMTPTSNRLFTIQKANTDVAMSTASGGVKQEPLPRDFQILPSQLVTTDQSPASLKLGSDDRMTTFQSRPASRAIRPQYDEVMHSQSSRTPEHALDKHLAESNTIRQGSSTAYITSTSFEPYGQPYPPRYSLQYAHDQTQPGKQINSYSSTRSQPIARPPTQKQNMLNGRGFYASDRVLTLEREICNAALWRFNSCSDPSRGISPEAQCRLFSDIVWRYKEIDSATDERSPRLPVCGIVGQNSTIEAPFMCEYGFNINIGASVSIGRHCTIEDSSNVSIRDRAALGPNVSIYTTYPSSNPRERGKPDILLFAAPVVIEEDVWIGGNVTILPGVKIKKGSTVEPGSVVRTDIQENTVVCGDPAQARIFR